MSIKQKVLSDMLKLIQIEKKRIQKEKQQVLWCTNCDNRFLASDTDKICKFCNTKNYEDVIILFNYELKRCPCLQCKQLATRL